MKGNKDCDIDLVNMIMRFKIDNFPKGVDFGFEDSMGFDSKNSVIQTY